MNQFPISRVCPQCGGTEYTMRKPKKLVAFTADRVCKGCQTRYSPPTPIWGGVMVMMATVVFGIVGFLVVAWLFNPFSILGLVGEAIFAIFFVRVFIGAVRVLIDAADADAIKQRT